jgi:hypothetical protein
MKTYASQSWSSYYLSSTAKDEQDFAPNGDLTIMHDEGVITINTPGEEAVKFERLSIEEAKKQIEFLQHAVTFAERQLNNTVCKFIKPSNK